MPNINIDGDLIGTVIMIPLISLYNSKNIIPFLEIPY